jgi:3-oxoadipate enol-lactonase
VVSRGHHLTVHHVVEGEGPPLVMSSSLGTTHRLWDQQLPRLAERHRVIRYDHPGHGRSPAGPNTIGGLAGEVLTLADELGLERFVFCGVSLGGMVGIWLGANAPDRLERLVLGCTAPHLPPAEAWQERADTVRAQGVAAIADTVVGRWFTERFRDEQPEVVRRYRQMLTDTTPEGYARCCEAVRDMDLRAELARIETPTTVILGAHDPVVNRDNKSLLAELGEIVALDAAHLANVEQPEAFTKAVLA